MIYRRRRHKIIGAVCVCLLAIVLTGGIWYMDWIKKPESRILQSVVYFMNHTLKNQGYLLHNIDIMEVFHDYANSDTGINGEFVFSSVQHFDSSIFFDVDGVRSFPQSKLVINSQMRLLITNLGALDLYAQNETVYLSAPLLGENVGYAFPTGINLFPKMPDLTSDIDSEWFHENLDNIKELTNQIAIDMTGKYIDDEDGTRSEEFMISIPEGKGLFIWDLLGMDYPEYDVDVSMYLTKDNRLRRMTIDLSDVLPGASIVIDGLDVGTMYFNYELPENESVVLQMVRNPDYHRRIDVEITYYANTSKIYTMTYNMTWETEEDNFQVKLNDILIKCDSQKLAEAYFVGVISKDKETSDIFEGTYDMLEGFDVLDWRAVRDDAKSFIDDVLSKTSLPLLQHIVD